VERDGLSVSSGWLYFSLLVSVVLSSVFKSNQTNYFIVRLKVDQRAGQLSLPHLGITKTEKNRTKT